MKTEKDIKDDINDEVVTYIHTIFFFFFIFIIAGGLGIFISEFLLK